MAQLPSQIVNWLYNVIQPQYEHKQLVYTHIYHFLQLHYKNNFHFKVRTRVYTWPDSGNCELLLQLYGSLFVNNVEVPLEIFIPFNYPINSVPIVHVIPNLSKGLYIKPGNYVDSSGRFYHPYLTDWHRNYTSLNAQNNYNLVYLIDLIFDSCTKETPITTESPASIPPPKPAKLAFNSQGPTPVQRQVTGVPLPPKPVQPLPNYSGPQSDNSSRNVSANPTGNPVSPSSTNPGGYSSISANVTGNSSSQHSAQIPLKYQHPLPVPQELSQGVQVNGAPPIQFQQQQEYSNPSLNQVPLNQVPLNQAPLNQALNQVPSNQPPPNQLMQPLYDEQPSNQPYSNQPFPQSYSNQPYGSSSELSRIQTPAGYPKDSTPLPFPIKSPPIPNTVRHPIQSPTQEIDLIDSETKSSGQSSNMKILTELSNKINELLLTENHHEILPKINENHNKVDILYKQINHHYEQAKANSQNLEYHTKYLQQQLSSITKFNQELQMLDQINHELSKISIGENKSFALDDLIIADSILVNQLYEVVSDIKAINDTINLISGKFPQKSEIINDNNLDTCVKTVRNLSRELFWLELTKNEIAKTMQLH